MALINDNLTFLKGKNGRLEMTICIAVKVGEGLILAADSTTTIQDAKGGVIKTYDYASKVAQIRDYPIGVFSWGVGGLGARSTQSLVMEFEHDLPSAESAKDFKVKGIADQFFEFFKQRYYAQPTPQKGDRPLLGLFVGGYSAGGFFPEEYWFELPKHTNVEVRRPDNPDGSPNFGADWFGQTDAISRLIHGYDDGFIRELINQGLDKAVIDQIVSAHKFEYPIVFNAMPLQDAIDLVVYLAQLTIGRFRFVAGVPVCGGEIDVAVITPGKFDWSHRKQWRLKD